MAHRVGLPSLLSAALVASAMPVNNCELGGHRAVAGLLELPPPAPHARVVGAHGDRHLSAGREGSE